MISFTLTSKEKALGLLQNIKLIIFAESLGGTESLLNCKVTVMIQRKQTVFLLLACILALVCFFVRLQWIDALQIVSAALSVYTIFQYRRRMVQARLCLAGLLVVFAWYIGLAILEGEAGIVESLPMVNAILIFLARKGILDDEKLVRAADRIR